MLDRLPDLNVPIVAINADYPADRRGVVGRPRGSPVLMSGVGHFLMMEDPDQFNRVLARVILGLG